MNLKWNTLVACVIAGYSVIASSQTVTGKIMIDGQEYSSGSSNVINGSGKIITDKRQLSTFDKLSINIAADIEYIASHSSRLELTADDNITTAITSTITGNTLSIDTNRSFSTQSRIRIKIYGISALRSLLVDGSSDVNLHEINGNSLTISLGGAGDISAQGKVKKLIINIDGSGSISTKNLQADVVFIAVDGSADVSVTANNKLDVVIDGVSDVTYYGQPASISKTIDGVGAVSPGN
jgi:hypothetical protein